MSRSSSSSFIHGVLGYSRSDILRKPTTSLSNTIIIPPARHERGKQQANEDEDDSEKAPFPRAYRRVKDYLKEQLQGELERKTHPLLLKIGEAKAAEELRAQLMAYACSEYPFNASLDYTSGRPVLQWWCDLESHAHARVLAVCSMSLIYAISLTMSLPAACNEALCRCNQLNGR